MMCVFSCTKHTTYLDNYIALDTTPYFKNNDTCDLD